MGITKEGIYLTLLIFQLVMTATIWLGETDTKHARYVRIEQLKLTGAGLGILLLTVGGYFIGNGNRTVEWIIALFLLSLSVLLNFKISRMFN